MNIKEVSNTLAMIGYNESTLSTSEIFTGLNNNNEVLDKVIKVISNPKNHLTVEDIEAAYITIKQFPNSLSRAAIRAFDEGNTIIIFNETREIKITDALPFITLRSGNEGKFKSYIFMDKYITRSKDGLLNVNAQVLHDHLIGALISNRLKLNYAMFASNQFLNALFMEAYSKFFTRILNKEYAIAPDKVVWDVINYWINRFFLETVIKVPDRPENIETLASKHFRTIDAMKHDEIKLAYNNAPPSNVTEIIELVKTASPRMKTLDFATFVSKWIDYYYTAAFLAIEVPEYLILMTYTLLRGNNIINMNASDLVKEIKNINLLQGELYKLI